MNSGNKVWIEMEELAVGGFCCYQSVFMQSGIIPTKLPCLRKSVRRFLFAKQLLLIFLIEERHQQQQHT
jgi:hypothetical protein